MASGLYIASCLTTLLCAILLLRGYVHVRRKLLLWSGLCFVVLTVSNLLVYFDVVLFPDIDLYTYRLTADAIAMALLLYGLIWESQ
jgi:energy-converting hydrogenase Eha subunit G